MIIDGKKEAAALRDKIKKEIELIKSKTNKVPGLTVILIGDFAPSQIYVRNKEKNSKEVGINSEVVKYPKEVTEQEVLKTDFLSQYTGQDLTFIFQSERLDLVSVLGSKLYCDMAVPAWQNKKSSSDLNARLMNNMYLSTKFGSANAVFATRHRIDCVAGFPSDFDRNQAVRLCQAHNKDQNRRIEFDNLGLPISFMTDGGKWLLDWSDFKLKNEVVTATTFNGIKTELFVCVDK